MRDRASTDNKPADPLRLELAEAIDNRTAAEAAVASVRAAVDTLTILVDRASGRVRIAEGEVEAARVAYVDTLTETSLRGERLRAPETPLSKSRSDEQNCRDELASARAALQNMEDKLEAAERDVDRARVRIDVLIKQIFLPDIPRRIEDAKRACDMFMSQTLALQQTADVGLVGPGLLAAIRDLRNKAQAAGFAYDNDFVSIEAAKWEAAREALRHDANAPLPA